MAQVNHKGDNICITRTISSVGWKDMPLWEYDITITIRGMHSGDEYKFTKESENIIVDDDTDSVWVFLDGTTTEKMSGLYFCQCEIGYNKQILHTNNIEIVEII